MQLLDLIAYADPVFSQLTSLIYGGKFGLFRSRGIDRDQDPDEYLLGIIFQQFRYFGPFPAKFEEIANLARNSCTPAPHSALPRLNAFDRTNTALLATQRPWNPVGAFTDHKSPTALLLLTTNAIPVSLA
jgi:hypothetical protein